MILHYPQSTGGTGGGPDPRATGFVPNPKAKLRDQVHEAVQAENRIRNLLVTWCHQ